VLLARSPRPQIWKYQSQDRTIRQKYRMWGPLAIATPRGKTHGFVVLAVQDAPERVSVERHFVPDLGMVREIAITALGDERLTRQELVLVNDRHD
jgi:hypothetical protein